MPPFTLNLAKMETFSEVSIFACQAVDTLLTAWQGRLRPSSFTCRKERELDGSSRFRVCVLRSRRSEEKKRRRRDRSYLPEKNNIVKPKARPKRFIYETQRKSALSKRGRARSSLFLRKEPKKSNCLLPARHACAKISEIDCKYCVRWTVWREYSTYEYCTCETCIRKACCGELCPWEARLGDGREKKEKEE